MAKFSQIGNDVLVLANDKMADDVMNSIQGSPQYSQYCLGIKRSYQSEFTKETNKQGLSWAKLSKAGTKMGYLVGCWIYWQ